MFEVPFPPKKVRFALLAKSLQFNTSTALKLKRKSNVRRGALIWVQPFFCQPGEGWAGQEPGPSTQARKPGSTVSDSPSCIPQQRRGGEADPGLAWEFPSAVQLKFLFCLKKVSTSQPDAWGHTVTYQHIFSFVEIKTIILLFWSVSKIPAWTAFLSAHCSWVFPSDSRPAPNGTNPDCSVRCPLLTPLTSLAVYFV